MPHIDGSSSSFWLLIPTFIQNRMNSNTPNQHITMKNPKVNLFIVTDIYFVFLPLPHHLMVAFLLHLPLLLPCQSFFYFLPLIFSFLITINDILGYQPYVAIQVCIVFLSRGIIVGVDSRIVDMLG